VALVLLQNPAVLMRGHGAAVVAPSLKSVVVRTYYLDMNARLQAQAILLGGKVNCIEPLEPGTTLGDNYDRVYGLRLAWKARRQPIAGPTTCDGAALVWAPAIATVA